MVHETKQEELFPSCFYLLESPGKQEKKLFSGEIYVGNQGKFGSICDYKGSISYSLGEPKQTTLQRAPLKPLKCNFRESSFKAYESQFLKVKEALKTGVLEKAVLYKSYHATSDFISKKNFLALAAKAKSSSVRGYLFGFYDAVHKKAVLGYSPEYLYVLSGEGFKTVAVAGTLPVASDKAWSVKLYDEHQKVVEGLSKSLKNHVTWTPVEERAFGAMKHLVSEGLIHSKLQDVAHALHPTSAVGTLPQDQFLNFGLGPKGRRHFGGYVDLQKNEQEAFATVCLRHFEWFEGQVQVCVGGGVTKESLLQEEWNELDFKWKAFCDFWSCESE